MDNEDTRDTNEDTQPQSHLSVVKMEVGENWKPRTESDQLEQGSDDAVEWFQSWTEILPWQEGCSLISFGKATAELLKGDRSGT